MKNKILLLEDDLTLNETLTEYSEENNFEVTVSYTGQEALEKAYEEYIDLFLFDVNVPDINGFDLLKKLRLEGKDTSCIFITSLNSMDNLEEGFESGCDDYIRKPFELKEMLIRINTILKRDFTNKKDYISITSDVKFDTVANVLLQNDVDVKLNQKELKLLKLFLKHPNELLSHDKIYEFVWDYDEEYSDNSLRTYLKNLRKYLGKDKIVSVKRLGYRFNKE
ncbi:MAG: response regulator transcription factor [Sulfurovum sp.]|jgi:DNA-binding response OmpR family regulator